jgi:hypothetical protein
MPDTNDTLTMQMDNLYTAIVNGDDREAERLLTVLMSSHAMPAVNLSNLVISAAATGRTLASVPTSLAPGAVSAGSRGPVQHPTRSPEEPMTTTTDRPVNTDQTTSSAAYYLQEAREAHASNGTNSDASMITAALLYVGGAIEAADECRRADMDALGALLDDKLADITVALTVRPKWWHRLLGLQPVIPDSVNVGLNTHLDEIHKAAALSYDGDDRR